MNRALVSLAIVASLLTTGCATTSSNGAALAGVNTMGLDRDDIGLSRRDERTARTSGQTEHHTAVAGRR